jgi:threonine/homoserine/homoserine lactone efflux protein
LAGGSFVIYLAWRLWLQWRKGADLPDSEDRSSQGSLKRGVIANFLTPGPYLFWSLVSGPILLSALRQSSAYGAAFLLGFYGIMVFSLLGIALIFSQTRRLGPRVVHTLLLISIIILVIFAAVLLKQAIFG